MDHGRDDLMVGHGQGHEPQEEGKPEGRQGLPQRQYGGLPGSRSGRREERFP